MAAVPNIRCSCTDLCLLAWRSSWSLNIVLSAPVRVFVNARWKRWLRIKPRILITVTVTTMEVLNIWLLFSLKDCLVHTFAYLFTWTWGFQYRLSRGSLYYHLLVGQRVIPVSIEMLKRRRRVYGHRVVQEQFAGPDDCNDFIYRRLL